MKKRLKNYKLFLESIKPYNNRFNYEEIYNKVIDLLNESLQQDQRDKLIYILLTLYSSGNHCWSYPGDLIDPTVGEDDEDIRFY